MKYHGDLNVLGYNLSDSRDLNVLKSYWMLFYYLLFCLRLLICSAYMFCSFQSGRLFLTNIEAKSKSGIG